jgi:hypothetical protein
MARIDKPHRGRDVRFSSTRGALGLGAVGRHASINLLIDHLQADLEGKPTILQGSPVVGESPAPA